VKHTGGITVQEFLQGLLSGSMKIVSDTDKTIITGAEIKIGPSTLSVTNGDCFVQLDNIAYVRKGQVAVTTVYPMMVLGIMSAVAVLLLIVLGFIDAMLALIVLVVALISIPIVAVMQSSQIEHRGLMIGLGANIVYAFICQNDAIVVDAYNFLNQTINGTSPNEQRVFDFGEGKYANSNFENMYRRHALPGVSDFDSKQFMDELIRSLEEIHYSRELGDQQKHLLISIMMDAKSGIERNSQSDIEQSRARFRNFAYKTKSTWPELMASLSTRPHIVKFFSTGS